MGFAVAIAKALASALTGGVAAHACCTQVALAPYLSVPATVVGSLTAFLYYARVFIQGYYFDQRCNVHCDLEDKVVVITGGTLGGLGFASAEILGRMGATVVLTVRSASKGEEAIAQLKHTTGSKRFSYTIIDFLSKKSVREGAASIISAHSRVDMLVLNAGIGSGPTSDVWMANQVGPFLFTNLLTPLLLTTAKSQGSVRVVAVSSGAHKRASIDYNDPYNVDGAYGQSKLAQIMHMRELQRKLRAQPGLDGEEIVRCLSITPGFALTNITAGKTPKAVMPLLWLLSRSAYVGAQVIKKACVDPDVLGGSYLSNCYVKESEGIDGCSNNTVEWEKLWKLCETCVDDDRYS